MADERGRMERRRIIVEARRIRKEIAQIFTDAASWNENTRHAHEAAIDPDPDGRLQRIADGLDRMLAQEKRTP